MSKDPKIFNILLQRLKIQFFHDPTQEKDYVTVKRCTQLLLL